MANPLNKDELLNISLIKLELYLISQHWQKTGEIKDFGSTWSLKKDDLKILLPLNKKFSDYYARMREVILTLEYVEKRPLHEIVDTVKNTSIIASGRGREIIEIVSRSTFKNKYEINAEKLAKVFKTIQNHLLKQGELFKTRRQLQESEREELELSLLNTFHGSFGVRLGFGDRRQLDTNNRCISEQVSESFTELLTFSGERHISAFRSYINSLENKHRISKSFQLFVNSLQELEADFVFDWGSVRQEKEKIVRFPYSKVLEVQESLSKEEIDNPREIEVAGKFIQAGLGLNKKERRFMFRTKIGEIIEGLISQDLTINLSRLELGEKQYSAVVEITEKYNPITGEIKTYYEIVNLKEIQN